MVVQNPDFERRMEVLAVLSRTAIDLVLNYAIRWGCSLLDAILETHSLSEQALASAFAAAYELPIKKSPLKAEFFGNPILPYRQAMIHECWVTCGGPAESKKGEIVVADPQGEWRQILTDLISIEGFELFVMERSKLLGWISSAYPWEIKFPLENVRPRRCV